MEPAVTYAREGYPVSPVISKLWNNAYKEFSGTLKDECFKPGSTRSPGTDMPHSRERSGNRKLMRRR